MTRHCCLVLAFVLVCAASARTQRDADLLRASGLSDELFAAPPGGSKYDGSGTLKPFPTDVKGTFFAGVFSDHVVLQRAPAKAAVYGVVIGAQPVTNVTVSVSKVTNQGGELEEELLYEVPAEVHNGGKGSATWKALLQPAQAGGNYSITATCGSCEAPQNSSTLYDVTYGDVWFCSGQSNMWLPMNMDTSRNITFDAVMRGKYQNIRMHSMAHNNQPDGGYNGSDLDIAPPPDAWHPYGGDAGGGWLLASVGTYANETCRRGLGDFCSDPKTCCTGYPQPNDDWLFNSINQFSAACWHFAEHLTDLMEKKNETVIPLGLIGSHWGGTEVQMWVPNSTLNSQTCKNASGGTYKPSENGRWDIDSGALFNGMVRPFLNMSIKGALWYQGENNVGPTCNKLPSGAAFSRPDSCGSVSTATGYACFMKTLIESWRKGWSVVPGTTDANFPFGLVTLAGGTSEGNGVNMGAFRYAQTGNTGGPSFGGLSNTFIAAGHDAADPCAGGNACCDNKNDGQGGWPCLSGVAPYTAQFMGGIHPRVKRIIGTRLAKAARSVVYGDKSEPWSGPVLRGCTVANNAITLKFDTSLLQQDSIMVLQQTNRAIALVDAAGQGKTFSADQLQLLQQLGGESPFELQLNGNKSADIMSEGMWLPAAPQSKCDPSGNEQGRACNWDTKTNQHTDGYDEVTVHFSGIPIDNITAIRYAWGESPCCPGMNRMSIPCMPQSCPIQTANSSLPAVPFWATIKDGKCDWVSTAGPPSHAQQQE